MFAASAIDHAVAAKMRVPLSLRLDSFAEKSMINRSLK